jgi:hypothetical protein
MNFEAIIDVYDKLDEAGVRSIDIATKFSTLATTTASAP